MGKVYKNQTLLTVKLTTKKNLTGITQKLIKYRKPSGTTGQFNAIIEDVSEGIISYKFKEGELNESGTWTFWAYLVFSNGDYAAGEPAFCIVYEEGY